MQTLGSVDKQMTSPRKRSNLHLYLKEANGPGGVERLEIIRNTWGYPLLVIEPTVLQDLSVKQKDCSR